jgi:glutaredoxin
MAVNNHSGQMNPVLYSFRRCPYAMRARLAIAVSSTGCVMREVKLSAKPEAMLAASPKGTVPVLVLPDCGFRGYRAHYSDLNARGIPISSRAAFREISAQRSEMIARIFK